MRTFHLIRRKDISGVSGTGCIAEGVEWQCGKVSICWLGTFSSTAQFDNMHQLEAIHGHEGATYVEWQESLALPERPSSAEPNEGESS